LLRPYQAIGHNWLRFLTSLGLGACLADDMGLGKTIQVLSLLVSLKEAKKNSEKPSLLVLPASLLANWREEIKRFAPTLEPCFVHPSETDKTRLTLMAQDPVGALRGKDIVLTTYGMILRQQWLLDTHWGLVILDEAQAIKNPGADQTKAVKKLRAQARLRSRALLLRIDSPIYGPFSISCAPDSSVQRVSSRSFQRPSSNRGRIDMARSAGLFSPTSFAGSKPTKALSPIFPIRPR
jgi:SNF2 family DNA or RNA helicase